LTDTEKQIRNNLRKRVDALIKSRNDFAHGIWATGHSEGDQTAWDRTLVMRDVASKEGLKIGNLPFTVDELEAMADEAIEVTGLLMTFSSSCVRPGHLGRACRKH
jgi:hypothetical protein